MELLKGRDGRRISLIVTGSLMILSKLFRKCILGILGLPILIAGLILMAADIYVNAVDIELKI